MEEILHQLKTVVYPIIYRILTIRLVVQDFFHPQYHNCCLIFPDARLIGKTMT